MDFVDELRWRGLIHQTTDDDRLPTWLATILVLSYSTGNEKQVVILQRKYFSGYETLCW